MTRRERCRCPGERPTTIATWRNSTLVSVVRHHALPCPLGDQELDRIDWQPRPGGATLAHTEPWWSHRKGPERPPELPEPAVRWKPRTDRRSSYRR